MSKLNVRNVKTPVRPNIRKNAGMSYNGNEQDLLDVRQALFNMTVTSLYGKDSYYETADRRVARLAEAVDNVVAQAVYVQNSNNLNFIANTIIYARTVMNIRSMPIVLTILFAQALRKYGLKYDNLRSVVRDVIQRADEITDLYAYALTVFENKKAVPMAIKRGVGDAFNKFDAYNFAKYDRADGVKFRDVLRIVHPVAASVEQGTIFAKIINESLETPYTWETELSRNGQLAESERKSKSQLWTELLSSGKVGYMALLRNLRNIGEAKVAPAVMKEFVYDRLSNKEQVLKSKQLPFRFFTALEATKQFGDNKLRKALGDAVEHSLGNVPAIGNNVWIIIDCSGSMSWGKKNIGMTPIQTATMFGGALAKAHRDSTNVKITMFSDEAKHIPVDTDEKVLTIVEKLMSKVYGGGTNLNAALNLQPTLGFEPDTVIILSDMQVNSLTHKNVSTMFKPGTVCVAVNLEGYDSTPVSDIDGWLQLSGWSDRIFDLIPALRAQKSIVDILSENYIGVPDIRYLFS